MKYSIALLLIVFTLLASCKTGKEKMIVKKWKTVEMKHSGMDRMIAEGNALIDTMTNKNIMLTKFKTMDSCKKAIRNDLIFAQEQLDQSAATTFLELKANGRAYFTSIEQIDSTAWHIEEDVLVLEDGELTDITTTTRMNILKLTDTEFNILMVMGPDTINIKMKPYKE